MPRTSVILWLCVLIASCGSNDAELVLAVSTEEPAPTIADAISSRLADENISIEVSVATKPDEIFASVLNGTVDLGVVEEPDRIIPGIVTVAPLYPSVLHILYDRDVDPISFPELIRDAKIYAGPVGGAANRLLLSLAQDFGVGNDFQVLDDPWTIKPDVFFIFGGLLSNDSVRQLDGYRLFSFGNEDEAAGHSVADAIVLRHHHLTTFLLPRGTYIDLSEDPVVTLSTRTVMIANDEFSADLAAPIVSLLFNNAQEFASEHPLVSRELNEAMIPSNLMFPLHDSTRRFLNRDEPTFIERYVDVIGLVITLVVTVFSGLFALYRRQKQIKKDRVDNYYAQVLEVREQAKGSLDSIRLHEAQDKVVELQETVLRLVIDERLAADSNLLAFLSLSNQVINELRQISQEQRN